MQIEFNKIKLHRIFSYYTVWSYILHILYKLNIIDSTYFVALFVFIFGNSIGIKSYYIDKKLPFEWFISLLLSHTLPFFIMNFDKTQNNVLMYSLILYILIFRQNIIIFYDDIYGYMHKI